MPRNMSFALTTEQIKSRTKTVTRRLGWKGLKPGERFWAVVKAQGLKKGEKLERLALLECVSNTPQPLNAIRNADVDREGFPGMWWHEFVAMFCKAMGCTPIQTVNRIEFKYVDQSEGENLEPAASSV